MNTVAYDIRNLNTDAVNSLINDYGVDQYGYINPHVYDARDFAVRDYSAILDADDRVQVFVDDCFHFYALEVSCNNYDAVSAHALACGLSDDDCGIIYLQHDY